MKLALCQQTQQNAVQQAMYCVLKEVGAYWKNTLEKRRCSKIHALGVSIEVKSEYMSQTLCGWLWFFLGFPTQLPLQKIALTHSDLQRLDFLFGPSILNQFGWCFHQEIGGSKWSV